MPAPYSDNMYSGLEDDQDDVLTNPSAENFHDDDAMSPTDGYFGDGAYASGPGREALVEDPSLRQREEEGKRGEAERERSLNTQRVAGSPGTGENQGRLVQQTPTASSFRRRSEEEEDIYAHSHSTPAQPDYNTTASDVRSPLFQQQPVDAPPAYSPPERSPLLPHGDPGRYQTFGAPPDAERMGVPEEQHRLLLDPGPESMSEGPNGDGEGKWGRAKGLRRKLKTLLGVLLVVFVLAILLSGFTWSDSHSHDELPPGSNPIDRGPDEGTPDPTDPTDPAMGDGQMQWHHSAQCHRPPHYSYLQAAYGVSYVQPSLTVLQTIHDVPFQKDQRSPSVRGEVIFRPTDANHAGGDFMLEIMTNDDDWFQGAELHLDDRLQMFNITVPRMVDNWHFRGQPCIQVRLTFWVPKGISVQKLQVQTMQLDIDVVKGVDANVEDTMVLETVSGDINLPRRNVNNKDEPEPYSLGKRNIKIKAVSGDVKGWFPLYDLLQIETKSGDVTVGVSPKSVDHGDPKPAKLAVSTVSGQITVQEPVDLALKTARPERELFPPRDYQVDLGSASGKIKADVAATSKLDAKTISDDMDLKIVPMVDLTKHGRLDMRTETKSGDIVVEVLEPLMAGILDAPPADQTLRHPGDEPWIIIHPHASTSARARSGQTLGNVQSKHATVSGDITVRYPSSWEGVLHAETISGQQDVRGEGLIVHRSRSPVMKLLDARKGKGGSEMTLTSVSGNENVRIGSKR